MPESRVPRVAAFDRPLTALLANLPSGSKLGEHLKVVRTLITHGSDFGEQARNTTVDQTETPPSDILRPNIFIDTNRQDS